MAEAPVVASLGHRAFGQARPRVSRLASATERTRDGAVAPDRGYPGEPRGVSEVRRAWNGEHIGAVLELRCECAQPNCRGNVPAVAETHRGTAECFIVMPAHHSGGVVTRAADQFFVVEPARRALPASAIGVLADCGATRAFL